MTQQATGRSYHSYYSYSDFGRKLLINAQTDYIC